MYYLKGLVYFRRPGSLVLHELDLSEREPKSCGVLCRI